MPIPSPASPEPDFRPTITIRPRVRRVNPQLSAYVHHLVETYPDESLRVVREWMAEGLPPGRRH